MIVDDGIATGSTVRAACLVARGQGVARLVVAVPVASRLATQDLKDVCDDLFSLAVPEPFYAVGEWYRDFSQTTDEEVRVMLRRQPWRDNDLGAESGARQRPHGGGEDDAS